MINQKSFSHLSLFNIAYMTLALVIFILVIIVCTTCINIELPVIVITGRC